MMTIRACRARSRNRPSPTTAGISSASATIAVWLARPPTSVAKPRTRCGSSPAVSLGERSCASSTVGVSRPARIDGGLHARELAEDPLLDVADIGSAGSQVRICQAFEPGGMAVEHLADRMLGRDQMIALDP